MEAQTAYQVLVASSAGALAEDHGDLWDSGKTASDQSALVYAGKPLASRTVCYWKVRRMGKDGQPSSWSQPAQWTMGLLHARGLAGRLDRCKAATDQTDPTVLGYATEAQREDELKWVQVDLGSAKKIERVVLHPMHHNDPAAGGWIKGYAFPLRFRLDASDDADV